MKIWKRDTDLININKKKILKTKNLKTWCNILSCNIYL